ncbi:RNA polymerase sigma factor [Parapedobacter deserti]|uniref:RNA polymerase sigma factor n=1 Tax=Parapedobacter deserti TaxID=1912957 RepID=A0ABV7JPA3_9SPHI
MRNLHDTDLVHRLRQRDQSAFEEVFEAHHRKIYQFALRLLRDETLSEEIVQDTFLQFWLHCEYLDDQRSVVPYLYVTARRTITDYWRKAATSKAFLDRLYHRIAIAHNNTEEQLNLRELTHVTQTGLKRLSDQQHAVFMLSRGEGLTYQEIAERMQISRDTVKYHLINALKILRKHFEQHGVTCIPLLFLC